MLNAYSSEEYLHVQFSSSTTGVEVGQVLERDLWPSGLTRMIEGQQPQ